MRSASEVELVCSIQIQHFGYREFVRISQSRDEIRVLSSFASVSALVRKQY